MKKKGLCTKGKILPLDQSVFSKRTSVFFMTCAQYSVWTCGESLSSDSESLSEPGKCSMTICEFSSLRRRTQSLISLGMSATQRAAMWFLRPQRWHRSSFVGSHQRFPSRSSLPRSSEDDAAPLPRLLPLDAPVLPLVPRRIARAVSSNSVLMDVVSTPSGLMYVAPATTSLTVLASLSPAGCARRVVRS